MTKLLSFLLAIAAALTMAELSSFGAVWFEAHLQTVPTWLVWVLPPVSTLLLALAASRKRRREEQDQAQSLTPLMPRSPETGLREL